MFIGGLGHASSSWGELGNACLMDAGCITGRSIPSGGFPIRRFSYWAVFLLGGFHCSSLDIYGAFNTVKDPINQSAQPDRTMPAAITHRVDSLVVQWATPPRRYSFSLPCIILVSFRSLQRYLPVQFPLLTSPHPNNQNIYRISHLLPSPPPVPVILLSSHSLHPPTSTPPSQQPRPSPLLSSPFSMFRQLPT